jgi:hypothetical protein
VEVFLPWPLRLRVGVACQRGGMRNKLGKLGVEESHHLALRAEGRFLWSVERPFARDAG